MTMRRLSFAIAVTVTLLSVSRPGWSQGLFADAAKAKSGFATANHKPAIRCEALRAVSSYDYSIVAVTSVAASNVLPAHCHVHGVIRPAIRFWLNLPIGWNGRLYMSGNGGMAGRAPTPDAPPWFKRPFDAGLAHGFAAVVTDTGHDNRVTPQGAFGFNNLPAEIDYGYRAVHLTAVTAKQFVATYYDLAPRHAYFNGCSTGGRQALMSAQRFPQDFDGIVAGAPVLDFTGTMSANVPMLRAVAEAALTPAKMAVLAEHIYRRCDEIDGLMDGVIDDPRQCPFVPDKDLPRCKVGNYSDACFTDSQIEALTRVYADVVVDDVLVMPGLPLGAEIAAGIGPMAPVSGWMGWLLPGEIPGMQRRMALSQVLAQTFFKYLAFEKDDATLDLVAVDLQRDLPRMARSRRLFDATDPDLTAFRTRGGKLLMYFGWADPALNPLMAVRYYQQVIDRMQNAETFFRLFMVPGMFHCAGGVGPDKFDAMTALIDWVEEDHAPEKIIASKYDVNGAVSMARPLCPYPQVARHSGQGDANKAENFRCVAPP